jgi:hypothetical protein
VVSVASSLHDFSAGMYEEFAEEKVKETIYYCAFQWMTFMTLYKIVLLEDIIEKS